MKQSSLSKFLVKTNVEESFKQAEKLVQAKKKARIEQKQKVNETDDVELTIESSEKVFQIHQQHREVVAKQLNALDQFENQSNHVSKYFNQSLLPTKQSQFLNEKNSIEKTIQQKSKTTTKSKHNQNNLLVKLNNIFESDGILNSTKGIELIQNEFVVDDEENKQEENQEKSNKIQKSKSKFIFLCFLNCFYYYILL